MIELSAVLLCKISCDMKLLRKFEQILAVEKYLATAQKEDSQMRKSFVYLHMLIQQAKINVIVNAMVSVIEKE